MARFRFKKPSALVIFALLFVLFLLFLTPKILHVRTLQKRSEDLELELRRLHLENRALETELRLLTSDPVYVEKVARQQLNKAREGEIVYKVVHSKE